MIKPVSAQASTLEKLQKGDVSGFVEEVRPCLAVSSPTSMHACMHAIPKCLLHTDIGMFCLHVPPAVGRNCLSFHVVKDLAVISKPPDSIWTTNDSLSRPAIPEIRQALTGGRAVAGDEEGCGHHSPNLLLLEHQPVSGLGGGPELWLHRHRRLPLCHRCQPCGRWHRCNSELYSTPKLLHGIPVSSQMGQHCIRVCICVCI